MIPLLRTIVLLAAVLLLTGFRWSLMFGELGWDEVNSAIDEEYPMVSHLSIDELKVLLDSRQPLYLVDVREAAEYQVSHLPGAVLHTSFQPKGLNRGVTIVAYCSVGLRSAKYVQQLQDRGFTDIYNLRGSLFAWANRGLPLTANGEATRYVHPYSERWGTLLNAELHSYNMGLNGEK